ncbi:MAG: DUF547 domain-containing protein [Proteobacteria bacterium]|nr:DUF547 domain-containing protein [Pseudomonadota bacterium]
MKKVSLSFGFIVIVGLLIIPNAFGFDQSHSLFDSVLKQHVVVNGPQSSVQYGEIKKNPDQLDSYIRELEAVSAGEFSGWTEPQQIAFLINAYNALTIKLILTKYPDLKSIKDLGGFFSGPWKVKFFTLFGEKHHLDHIEHELLRVNYTEPRIHFALVCASIGCPPLITEAYTGDRLDEQLNRSMISFLRDPERNRYDEAGNTLYLSSIFKWFSEDFTKVKPSVEAFVAPWISDDKATQDLIAGEKVDVEYLDYDWSLNRSN